MEISLTFGVIVALVVGVTQVIKTTGFVPKRFHAVVSLALGVAFISAWTGVYTGESVLQGLVVGLSASGLWSGTKNLIS